MAKLTPDEVRASRRFLLDVARRKQRPGSGSQLTGGEASMDRQWPDLLPVLRDLRWAIVGAVATREYMPERMTGDLDVAVATADLAAAEQSLLATGFSRTGSLAIGGSSWRSVDGVPVDLLEARESWWDEAFAAARENRDERGSPILPLAFLVLMKMKAGRMQDTADASRMLGRADDETLEATRRLFERMAPDERDDLEAMIQYGRLEYERDQ